MKRSRNPTGAFMADKCGGLPFLRDQSCKD
jgi:hypothetical protein